MTSPRDFSQFTLINEILSIEYLSTISRFFELRDIVRDVAYDIFYSRLASPFRLNLIVVI